MRVIKTAMAAVFLALPAPLLAAPPLEIASAASARAAGDSKGNPRLELLGLRGLIGLLGLIRPEPSIHVDARRKPPRQGS
jgi:hypothetical protein